MVNNTELRLGNTVQYNGKIHTVNMLIAKGIGIDDELHKEEDIYPIEVNEETLERYANDVIDVENWDMYRFNKCSVELYKDTVILYFTDCELDFERPFYLHQLQNLYFDLNNEELFKPI